MIIFAKFWRCNIFVKKTTMQVCKLNQIVQGSATTSTAKLHIYAVNLHMCVVFCFVMMFPFTVLA